MFRTPDERETFVRMLNRMRIAIEETKHKRDLDSNMKKLEVEASEKVLMEESNCLYKSEGPSETVGAVGSTLDSEPRKDSRVRFGQGENSVSVQILQPRDRPRPLSLSSLPENSSCEVDYSVKHRHFTFFVTTWNVGNAAPPSDLTLWLGQTGVHDFYVIGAQECKYNPSFHDDPNLPQNDAESETEVASPANENKTRRWKASRHNRSSSQSGGNRNNATRRLSMMTSDNSWLDGLW